MKLQKALFESSSRPVSAQSFLGTRVTMALFLAKELDATNIGVSTMGSTVTLSGEVAAGGDRLTAEKITRQVLGVSIVRNRLVDGPRVVKDSTSRADLSSVSTLDRPEASEPYRPLRLVHRM